MICLNKNLTLALLLSFTCLSSSVFGYQLMTGDENAAQGQTFSFSLGNYAINTSGEYFFVTAQESGAKEFTISRVGRGRDQFFSLVPKFLEVNGEAGKENPLYNVGIKFFSLLENRRDRVIDTYPVAVTSDNPTAINVLNLANFKGVLYKNDENGLCDKKSSKLSLVSFDSILDAEGVPIGAIESIAAASPGYIFAAVSPIGNPFGSPGSGIAAMMLAYRGANNKNKSAEELAADKAHDKELENLEKGLDKNKESAEKSKPKKKSDESSEQEKESKRVFLDILQGFTAALNITSAVVKIEGDLESIEVSDMYWDNALSCLFIALKVQAGASVSDGCKALVLGKIEEGKLVLKNFAPNDVFVDQNEIVGAVGSNVEVSLHKVRTMLSSNRLRYAIVLGGNGASGDTKRKVFALPLVNDLKETGTCCVLAKKDSLPEDTFRGTCIKRMASRTIKDPAQSNDDMLKEGDAAAQVGGSQLDYDISDIFVVGDAVFALIEASVGNGKKNGATQQGSLHMSRALFDENGKIKRWTNWQRVSSADGPLFGNVLDAPYGNFYFLSGMEQNNVKTVKRTVWGTGDENGLKDLISAVGSEFPKELAGIQGLFEFPYNQQGAPLGLKNITMLAATGYKKVVLAELAQMDTRNVGDFSTDKQVFTDGTLNGFFNGSSRVISISGGVLDEIGPIESCTVTLQVSGRLWVGGVGGLAVLVDATNGDGWDLITGLGPNFAGLTDSMVFKKVGDFRFVSKLLQEGDYLYILTDKKLYRVDLTASDFVTGVLDVVEIASLETVSGLSSNGTLLDFVASGKLGILATSVGMFRVGNGKNVQVDVNLNWTEVEVPSYCGPIKQLLAVSQSLREQDVAKEDLNGVLYVLGAYSGKNISQFNRFTIKDAEAGEVDSQTILPLPDYFVQDQSAINCSPTCACPSVCSENATSQENSNSVGKGLHSYFVHFGTFRELLEDEGAMRFSSFDRDLCNPPMVRLLPPGHVSGAILPIVASKTIDLSVEKSSDIVKILRSVTGPMFIAGDFGLKVNE